MKNEIDPVMIDTYHKENWLDKASPWIAAVALLLMLLSAFIVEYFTR